ncbi:MAG: PIN/TRAM domain-containing protein [Planctomycetota bacterium]|nr:PIN/TRAM domain-containing protein [Planctomycetota bacterium]
MPDERPPASPAFPVQGAAAPQGRPVERRATLQLLRIIFLVLLFVFTALVIVTDSTLPGGGIQLVRWWPLAVVGALLFFGGIIALDILTPKRKLSTLSAILVGLLAGVVVAAILGIVIDLFSDIYGFGDRKLLEPFKILMGLGICYLTISTVLQTQDDFRLVIPYVEFARKIRGARPLLLDTSALIDGRVLALAETGVFQAPMVVPRFVIDELQRLSDSADKLKRARGRRGLDLVGKLQRAPLVDLSIDETVPAGAGVDQMLVEFARTAPATLVTTDSGLARVAAIQGVPVINLHEVAAACKPAVIPGELLTLTVVRTGEQPGQGVGYLDDGTMIVVEDGAHAIGRDVSVNVTSSMQTSAGRLIFARLAAPTDAPGALTPAPPAPQTVPTAAHEAPSAPPAPADRPLPQPSASSMPAPTSAPLVDAPRPAEPPAPVPRGPFGPGRTDQPRSPRNPRR